MSKNNSSIPVIVTALIANFLIAICKFVVAFFSRSSAMLAEAVHSTADTLNQVFLLIGIKKGKKEPDSLHPFGFASELYFWSFIVAIILFTTGAIFSIYEGIHKLMHPAPIKNYLYCLLVLGFSLTAEGFAFFKAFKKVNKEKGELKILSYLRKTKKSELIVVFLEDSAAIIGLLTAAVLITVQHFTAILILDGIASIIIGIILCAVALFLGNETRSLLIGESADPRLIKKIAAIFHKEESITHLISIKSLQLGAEDILIAVKAEFSPRLNSTEISHLINGIEQEIRTKFPDIQKILIEPDIYRKRI